MSQVDIPPFFIELVHGAQQYVNDIHNVVIIIITVVSYRL